MCDKMTKRELSQLYFLKKEINHQKQRLNELLSAADYQPQDLSGMPHGNGKTDKTGNIAVEIAEMKRLIDLNLEKCNIEKVRLERYIQSVEDSYMRELLRLRFMECRSWVGISMCISNGRVKPHALQMKLKRFLDKNKKAEG